MWVDLEQPERGVISQAAEVIRAGGVVLYPADTIYGLGCDPWSVESLKRIYEMKGRPSQKGVLLLIPSIDWLDRLGEDVPAVAHELAGRFWPGPLTIVVQGAKGLPPELTGGSATIGLRMPDSAFLRAWMEEIPGPVVSTSANRSGEPVPDSPEGLLELFGREVDLALVARRYTPAMASTVVDATGDAPCIVREGGNAREVSDFLRARVETGDA